MTLLKRVLYLDALLNAALAVALIAFPRFLLVDLFDQPVYPDYAFVRVFGAAALALALLEVLVGQRAQELYYWCWTFVLFEGARAAILTLHVLFGLPEGAGSFMWWLGAGVRWAVAFGLVLGIGRAATEAEPR
ncbi:MAG: hypothetical protein ACRDHM_03175 [Actinomycetota bacterium]